MTAMEADVAGVGTCAAKLLQMQLRWDGCGWPPRSFDVLCKVDISEVQRAWVGWKGDHPD